MRTPHPAVSAQLDELLSWLKSGEPLALDPEWIARMMAADATSRREVEGFFFLFDEKVPLSYTLKDGVALIPIQGPIAKKSDWRVTYSEITDVVGKAVSDKRARAILLNVDSPGGVVSGMYEAAAAVRDAAKQKPVWAVANDYMASAAYGVSSGATKILSTRYGTTGSIGVVLMHLDYSKQNEMRGVKPTFIVGGRKKAWGNPEEPLSEEAKADLQATVNHFYNGFIDLVAEHRGLERARVLSTEAGVFLPEEARAVGLVDEVRSFDECASALSAEMEVPMAGSNHNDDDKKAEVVDLDAERERARADGRREAAERAKAIQRLCALAGKADLAGDFIAGDKTVEQVSDALIEMRAKDDDKAKISGVHGTGNDGTPARKLSDAMVDLVKSRGMEPRKDTLRPL